MAYASSSLLGYFGTATMPLARLARTNGVSLIAAGMDLTSVMTGGVNLAVLALTVLHMYDAFQGATQPPQREGND